MKILIAGVAGFIGSHLADRLIADDHHIIGIDNLSTGQMQNIAHLQDNSNFEFQEIDVTDQLVFDDKIDAIVDRTKKGGGELVNLMGTSAWYAPGAGAAQMVEAIIKDERRIFPCCAWLQGEYGMKDMSKFPTAPKP